MPKYPVGDSSDEEKNLAEEPTQTNPPEETPASEAKPDEETEEDIDWKERALKAETVAENYKKENQKYRGKKERTIDDEPTKGSPSDVKRDFLSKREDVLDEMRADINKLGDEEWGKVEYLFKPAVDRVLDKAAQEGRFVAKGEIKRVISDVIQYAKDKKSHAEEVEQARVEGAREADKMEQAEIGGVKRTPSQDDFSDEVRKLAEEKGWDLRDTKEILEKRKERERDYAVRGTY